MLVVPLNGMHKIPFDCHRPSLATHTTLPCPQRYVGKLIKTFKNFQMYVSWIFLNFKKNRNI